MWRPLALPIGIGMGGFILDQVSKSVVRAATPLCSQFPVETCQRLPLFGSFAIVRVENTGTGFSFLRSPLMALLLALLGCFLLVLYTSRVSGHGQLLGVGIGLQIGGAFGNLADRLWFGGVTDFINYAPTKTFNLGDVLLVTGLIAILIGLIIQADRLGQASSCSVRRRLS